MSLADVVWQIRVAGRMTSLELAERFEQPLPRVDMALWRARQRGLIKPVGMRHGPGRGRPPTIWGPA